MGKRLELKALSLESQHILLVHDDRETANSKCS